MNQTNILKVWKRAIRKVQKNKRRGLKYSLQSSLNVLEDGWFDLRYGVDTGGWVYLKNLEVNFDHRKKGRRYQATRVRAFRKLCSKLALPKENVFVDVGSGKGRMLLLAMEYGFTRAVGVDFSNYLCQIARKNVEIFRRKCKTDTKVEIIESDVMDYEANDDETVYFLFNPFDDHLMELFMRKLSDSLQRRNRELWIIYNNPVHRKVVEAQNLLKKFGTFHYGNSQFHIYIHRVIGAGVRVFDVGVGRGAQSMHSSPVRVFQKIN